MKRIRIELDETTVKRLRAVAPGSRRRSQFILESVRRMLDALEERRMEAAYRRKPYSLWER